MKNIKKKIFLLLIFIFVAWANYCFALEIKPEDWPRIPLTRPITVVSTLPDYIVYFFALGIYVGGALAVISLAIAGIQLIMSAENPDNRNQAIEKIRGSLIGLALLLGAFIIIITINPQLQTVATEPLKELGGLRLQGAPGKSAPAPMNAYTLDVIKKDYDSIYWPQKTQDTAGNEINNCDPAKNEVYVIYWYNDKNFKNFWGLNRLKCGEQDTNLLAANSYVIIKEQPGVYFYSRKGCQPPDGSDSSKLPGHSAQSMPESTEEMIRSIRIVNGPDPYKGPFFGVIYFVFPDYKVKEEQYGNFRHFVFNTNRPANDDYSNCINIQEGGPGGFKNGSYVIYKWAGFNSDGTVNSGSGVTLYSRSAWTGGSYSVSAQSEGKMAQIWNKELQNVPVYYSPNTTIQKEEQKLCGTFNPKKNCLQSFEIKGNFLVLVSSKKDGDNTSYTSAQVFPISPRIAQAYENRPEGYSIERGTPELASDFITSGNAYYMEIIPLAENLVSSH